MLLGHAWAKIFYGLGGSGKSYHAVLQMAQVFADGGFVSSNIAIKHDGMRALIRAEHGVEVDTESRFQLLGMDEMENVHLITPPGSPDAVSLIVVDEADVFWPAREASKTYSQQKDFIKFVKTCRHHYTQIIFITQSTSLLNASLRNQCELWDFRDMALLSLLGWRPWKHFLLALQRYPSRSGVMARKFRRRSPLVFGAYDSRQFAGLVSRGEAVQRGEVVKTRAFAFSWERHKKYVIPLVFCAVMAWLWHRVQTRDFDTEQKRLAAAAKAAAPAAPSVVPSVLRAASSSVAAAVAPSVAPRPEEPREWTGPDGVRYYVPPSSVVVARFCRVSGGDRTVWLSSPPYETNEILRPPCWSVALNKFVVSYSERNGEQYLTMQDGTDSRIVYASRWFSFRGGVGSGGGGGVSGAPRNDGVPDDK